MFTRLLIGDCWLIDGTGSYGGCWGSLLCIGHMKILVNHKGSQTKQSVQCLRRSWSEYPSRPDSRKCLDNDMFQYAFFGRRCWRTNDNKCFMSATRYAARNVASRTVETNWTFLITARRMERHFGCQCYFIYWWLTYLFARFRLRVNHSSSTLNPKIHTIIPLSDIQTKEKTYLTLNYFKKKVPIR